MKIAEYLLIRNNLNNEFSLFEYLKKINILALFFDILFRFEIELWYKLKKNCMQLIKKKTFEKIT